MKNLLQILFFFLLILITAFPQDRIYDEFILENGAIKNLQEILKLNAGVLQGSNGKDSKITTYKTQLDNGFLLMEEIHQEWDTTHWVNSGRSIYKYDINNNNLIETLGQSWDTTHWVNSGKFTFTYNLNNNNLIQILVQNWDGSNWVLFGKYTLTYDVNNNLFRELLQEWDGSNWVNVRRRTYTFDLNNNMIGWLWEDWNDPNWVNKVLETYLYDENNNMIEDLRQVWDVSNWVNDWKGTFFYDENNNRVQELHLNWYNSSWVNHWKYTYIYDVNNNLVELLKQWWWNSNWKNSLKFTYTYDINNNTMIETFVQQWGSNWANYERFTYYYMPAGSELFEHKRSNVNKSIEDFQTTEDDLIITSLSKANQTLSLIGVQVLIDSVLHTSDSDLEFTLSHNGVSETIIYQVGGSGDNFIGTKLIDDGIDSISNGIAPFSGNYKPENPLSPFAVTDPTGTWTLSIYDGVAGNTGMLESWGLILIYNSAVGVEDENSFTLERFSLYQNYPNPFNPSTKISWQSPVGSWQTLKVYDILGNEIATLVDEYNPAGEYEVDFNIHSGEGRNLSSGIYFYQLRAGSFIQTKKMILIK